MLVHLLACWPRIQLARRCLELFPAPEMLCEARRDAPRGCRGGTLVDVTAVQVRLADTLVVFHRLSGVCLCVAGVS